MKRLKFLLLPVLAITLIGSLKAQQKDHPYIPLFDTNKVWYSIRTLEFGGFNTYVLHIDYENDILNVNDTLYYRITDVISKDGNYYREDTATQRIYYRGSPDYPEKLIYDFSMQEGDSMYTTAFSVPGLWLYTDSVRTKTFFGKERKVYYLTDIGFDVHPVWIEGIGSLAGLPNAVDESNLDWLVPGDYLTCYYNNDTLLYQSYYGEIYGCRFELLDTTTPVIDTLWFGKDTINSTDKIRLFVKAYDEFGIYSFELGLKKPNGQYISIQDTLIPDSNNIYHIDLVHNWNQIGIWEGRYLILYDKTGNDGYKQFYPAPYFYVKELTRLDEQLIDKKIIIKPNPIDNTTVIEIENPENQNIQITIFDIFGNTLIRFHSVQSIIPLNFNIEPGVYFVNIKTNNYSVTKKIIKQ